MKKIIIIAAAVLMLLTGVFAIPQVRNCIADYIRGQLDVIGCSGDYPVPPNQ